MPQLAGARLTISGGELSYPVAPAPNSRDRKNVAKRVAVQTEPDAGNDRAGCRYTGEVADSLAPLTVCDWRRIASRGLRDGATVSRPDEISGSAGQSVYVTRPNRKPVTLSGSIPSWWTAWPSGSLFRQAPGAYIRDHFTRVDEMIPVTAFLSPAGSKLPAQGLFFGAAPASQVGRSRGAKA